MQTIDETAADWIKQLEAMVDVWKKQAETAEKVSQTMSTSFLLLLCASWKRGNCSNGSICAC